jgi:hypothetical protein
MRNRVLAFSFFAFLAMPSAAQRALASSVIPPHITGSEGGLLSKEFKDAVPQTLQDMGGMQREDSAEALHSQLSLNELPQADEAVEAVLEPQSDAVSGLLWTGYSFLDKAPVHPQAKPLYAEPHFTSNEMSGAVALPQDADFGIHRAGAYQFATPQLLSQTEPLNNASPIETPDESELNEVQTNLEAIDELGAIEDPADFSSPSLTVAIPSGFGVDRNTFFISGTFQERTRFSDVADGGLGLGVGLFDARRFVGVEVSYTLASFGRNRSFGTGGFNLKLHRRFSESFSAAIGWNGFLTVGDDASDFEDSVYGVATKIFRTREDVNQPFSRIALTAGLGNGQFRLEDDVFNDISTINPFGSVAVRIVEPVSFITEWTGQDLALGVSIAPFNNFNFVITPALRDITGAGDGARFVLGFGTSFRF